jgi:hypothetical protein
MANQSFDVTASDGKTAVIVNPAAPDGVRIDVVVDEAKGSDDDKKFKIIVYEVDAQDCNRVIKEWWSKEFQTNYPWKQEEDFTAVGLAAFSMVVQYSNGYDTVRVKGSFGPTKEVSDPYCPPAVASTDGGTSDEGAG